MYQVFLLPFQKLDGESGPYNEVYQYLLHDTRTFDRHILNPELKMCLNKSGTFSFTVTTKHPYYASMLDSLNWDVSIYRDGVFLWAGHPLMRDVDLYGNAMYTCEGILGVLYDGVISPFSGTKTPSEWLQYFLNAHTNSQLLSSEGYKAFHRSISPCTKSDFDYAYSYKQNEDGTYEISGVSPNSVRRYSTHSVSTLDAIQTRLIDYFGGMIKISMNKSGEERCLYALEYLDPEKSPEKCTLEIGKNITDLKVSIDYTGFCTAILALADDGEEISCEHSNAFSIEAHEGMSSARCPAKRAYFVNDTLCKKYGLIVAEKNVNSDVANDANGYPTTSMVGMSLIAASELKEPRCTVEVQAIDIDMVSGKKAINIGDRIRIKSESHRLNTVMTVSDITMRLDDPTSNALVLSGAYENESE